MTNFRLQRKYSLGLNASTGTTGAISVAAGVFTLSGPTTGNNGIEATFTVTPNGNLGSSVVVTPAATNSGVVSPTTITFPAGLSTARTFTVTRASTGTSSVSITNNGGLANAGTPISFSSTPVPTSGSDNWSDRISGPGVVWWHNFDTVTEVNQFRWAGEWIPGSGWGGQDPNAISPDGPRCQHVSSGGADGGGFLRLTYPAGATTSGAYWWRCLAPLTGAGNGKGIDDPAAAGTIPLQNWNVVSGGSTAALWSRDASNPAWYGSASAVAANPTKFQGTDFYLQIRIRRAQTPGPPRDATVGSDPNNSTGKSFWLTTTNSTATQQEIVTYGQSTDGSGVGYADVVGTQSVHRMYGGYNFSPFGGGQHNESVSISNIDTVSDWRYSGGWDTLLYHVTPGPEGGTGSSRGRIEVWAQHDLTLFPSESGVFVKIWDTVYTNHFNTGTTNLGSPYYPGWNAVICAIYHNGAHFNGQGFQFDYDQIIFSKNTIPAPTSVPTWATGASGTITAINSASTTIRSAATAAGAASYPGTGSANLAAPWSGGALVTIGGKLYLTVEGGGHTDGSWNGIIKFGPLTGAGADNPTWTLWFPASPLASVRENNATYTDGKQTSTHTYAQLVGVGSSLYELQTTSYGNPGNEFQQGFVTTDGSPPTQASIGTIPMGLHGAGAYYNGKIYFIGGNGAFDRLRTYTISGGALAAETSPDIFLTADMSMAIDTTRGKVLAVGSNTAYYWDAVTLSRRQVTTTSGSTSSLEYDPARDMFIMPISGQPQVKEYSAATLASGGTPTWTTRTFTGTTPVATVPAGSFGRFRAIPALGGYIYAPTSDSQVYFFKS
jgi:hypothetical protein